MATEQERRRFHRFPFDADCELLLADGAAHACELLDLSINGALLELARPEDFDSSREGDLTLKLRGLINDRRTEVELGVRAVRVEESRIACRFVAVDPDSFRHLKDLVAENLGDLTLLDRELTQLDYWPGLSVSPASSG